MAEIKALYEKYKHIISYIFFGGLTTVVNYVVYYPLYNFGNASATVSNVIAWAVAVAFAYVTNKLFVFESKDWSVKLVVPEVLKFVGSRLGSGVLETVFISITVDLLHWNGNWMKLLISIIVVILNYITSKLLVFKKN